MPELNTDDKNIEWLKTAQVFWEDRHPLPVSGLFPVVFEKYLTIRPVRDESYTRNPKRLIANTGDFSVQQVERIVQALSLSADTDMFCYYDRNSLVQLMPCPTELAYTFKLSELTHLMKLPETGCTPTAWWPKDRSWFFFNDVDLMFGIFGGPESLALRLKATEDAEEISPETTTPQIYKKFWE